MARVILTVTFSDLTPDTTADRTVRFALGDAVYEVSLTQQEFDTFMATIAPYKAAARRTGLDHQTFTWPVSNNPVAVAHIISHLEPRARRNNHYKRSP